MKRAELLQHTTCSACRRKLMHARSMLPPACEHALKKAPAGEKT